MSVKRLSDVQARALTDILDNGAWTSSTAYMRPFWWVGQVDDRSHGRYLGGNTAKSLVKNGLVSIARIEGDSFRSSVTLTQRGADALADYNKRRGEA